MVRRITAAGVAAKDGKLHVGDKLVSVNGASLKNLPHAAVLKALGEAGKEVNLVVWRDPNFNLASSSMHSLGSYSNLSGSRSSLVSEDMSGDSSPVARKQKQTSRGLSAASPLVTRYSFAGVHSPSQTDPGKRLSDGNLLGYSPTLLHELAQEEQHLSLPVLDVGTIPPDLPESKPPPEPETLPPELPEMQPPKLALEDFPEINSELPQLPSNIAQLDEPVCEVPQEATVLSALSQSPESHLSELPSEPPEVSVPEPPVLPSEPPEIPLSEPPVPPSEPPEIPNSEPPVLPSELPEVPLSEHQPDPLEEQLVSSRPPSLKVPQGSRLENSPFEIELRKGVLGLGVSLAINQMGMLAIKSLSSRSIVSQDGNIRYTPNVNDVTP